MDETPTVPTAPSAPEVKLFYFMVSSEGVKMIMWGDASSQNGIQEAVPVALFPKPVSEDIVKDCLVTITVKDPDGTIGKEVKKSVEEQIAAEKKIMEESEQSGLPPGELIPEDTQIITPDEAADELPFVV